MLYRKYAKLQLRDTEWMNSNMYFIMIPVEFPIKIIFE